jgi:hypothetical protein
MEALTEISRKNQETKGPTKPKKHWDDEITLVL